MKPKPQPLNRFQYLQYCQGWQILMPLNSRKNTKQLVISARLLSIYVGSQVPVGGTAEGFRNLLLCFCWKVGFQYKEVVFACLWNLLVNTAVVTFPLVLTLVFPVLHCCCLSHGMCDCPYCSYNTLTLHPTLNWDMLLLFHRLSVRHICTCLQAYIQECIHTYLHNYMHAYICLHACRHVRMHVCM